jgi:hypothetical protein
MLGSRGAFHTSIWRFWTGLAIARKADAGRGATERDGRSHPAWLLRAQAVRLNLVGCASPLSPRPVPSMAAPSDRKIQQYRRYDVGAVLQNAYAAPVAVLRNSITRCRAA